MHSIRRLAALALIVGVVGSCTDQADRGLTGPTAPQFARTPDPATEALVEEIFDAIECVYFSDQPQLAAKLREFQDVVARYRRDNARVKKWVNSFVAFTEYLIAEGYLTTACDGKDIEVAAQELYNLLYLYSYQTDEIETPDYEGDAAVGVFVPGEDLDLETEGANVHVPEDAFDVPVIVSLRQATEFGPPYAPFNSVGTPIRPPYEFSVSPNIEANRGWYRGICVSHSEVNEPGTLQEFRNDNGVAVGIPSNDDGIICPNETYARISNPVLRGAYRLASRITAPLRPRLLYAAQHRAIGGPGTSASVHMVVRLPGECTNGSNTDCNPAGSTLNAGAAFVDPSPPANYTQCAGFINTTADDVRWDWENSCIPFKSGPLFVRIFDDVSGQIIAGARVHSGVALAWAPSTGFNYGADSFEGEGLVDNVPASDGLPGGVSMAWHAGDASYCGCERAPSVSSQEGTCNDIFTANAANNKIAYIGGNSTNHNYEAVWGPPGPKNTCELSSEVVRLRIAVYAYTPPPSLSLNNIGPAQLSIGTGTSTCTPTPPGLTGAAAPLPEGRRRCGD
jgi:hypothetical protein